MKNILRKSLITFLLITLLSACAVNIGNPETVEDPQVDQPLEELSGNQASAILNEDLIFTFKPNEVFDGNAVIAFSQALEEGRKQFTSNNVSYHYEPLGQDSYRIYRLTPIAESLLGSVEPVGGAVLSNELLTAIKTAMAESALTFEHQGETYVLSEARKAIRISTMSDVAIANRFFLEAYDPAYNEVIHAYNFVLNLELALRKQERSFFHEGDKYGILAVAGGYSISDPQSNLFAELSNIYVIPKSSSNSIPLGFKNLVRDAIGNDKAGFTYTDSAGVETEYQVEKLEKSWSVNPAQ
jgi:hypothetical protein